MHRPVLTWLLGVSLACALPARAEGGCTVGNGIVPDLLPPSYPLLAPGDSGANSQSRLGNYLTLLDDLYLAGSTRMVLIEGLEHELPPWFDPERLSGTPLDCTEPWLHRGPGGLLTTPTLEPADYLVVSDELSELAVVTAMGHDAARMTRLDRTIQRLMMGTGQPFAGLPCWLGHVDGASFVCPPGFFDSATDATVRFGLAYYLAARNTKFPAAHRATYRARADGLADRHFALEYQHLPAPCPTGPVSGRPLCDWVAAGAATAAGEGLTYIGYYQDVVRFLLAAYAATGNAAYYERATAVVEQFLLASTFDTTLSFGRKCFLWDFTQSPPQPVEPPPEVTLECGYWWGEGRAWDVADAPRALWMGDVLRAHHLATGGAPLPAAYESLRSWVELVLTATSPVGQTDLCSCVQYNQDGSVVAGNCSTGHYANGLGLGLFLYAAASMAEPKLDEAMTHYLWNLKRWDDQNERLDNGQDVGCFFIYRGVRTMKALAAAIGLDDDIYLGLIFSDGFESGDTSAWSSSVP